MKKLSNFLAATALLVAVGHASAADQVVKIGYQNEPDPSHAAIVASDYEKALGAKIDWRKFDSGASVIAALASGSIDIGYAGSRPLAAGLSRGAGSTESGSWSATRALASAVATTSSSDASERSEV